MSKLGVMISEFGNPNIVRIFQRAGYDFLIVDNEHGYFNYTDLAAMIGIANGFNIPIIIRVPGTGREAIIKVLDMGADGILVPMVSTLEQAEEVVRYSKYTPVGSRGVSTTRAHTNYGVSDLREYMDRANREKIVCIQFENRTALENADAIARLEGIDALFIGPNDLAADLGKPGEVSSEEVLSAVDMVGELGKKLGKPTGIITGNKDLMRRCMSAGFEFFSYGSELDLLMQGARQRKAVFEDL